MRVRARLLRLDESYIVVVETKKDKQPITGNGCTMTVGKAASVTRVDCRCAGCACSPTYEHVVEHDPKISLMMGRTATRSVSRVYPDVNAKLGPSWHEYGMFLSKYEKTYSQSNAQITFRCSGAHKTITRLLGRWEEESTQRCATAASFLLLLTSDPVILPGL